jgi:hypothetical protein
MRKGFAYLTAVIDVLSLKVLAHITALTLQSCHAVNVLNQAFAKHGVPEIVNVDNRVLQKLKLSLGSEVISLTNSSVELKQSTARSAC